MGWAINLFNWTPDQFWNATPHELYAAMEARTPEDETGQQEREYTEWLKSQGFN